MEDIERNSRKFVLITKIIQKLANFQLFQKEKHMLCFNSFIEVHIPKMKEYLLEISQSCDPSSSTFLASSSDLVSCCGLADTLAASLGALFSFKTDTALLTELDRVIKQLREGSDSPSVTPILAIGYEKTSPQSVNFINKHLSHLKQKNEIMSNSSLTNLGSGITSASFAASYARSNLLSNTL